MIYRIGVFQPSRAGDVERILSTAEVEYLYPRVPKIMRVGRKRERKTVNVPLIPGVAFISEPSSSDAEKALRPEVIQIRWMKNPADGGNYATCELKEIDLMMRQVENELRAFIARNAPKPPAPERLPARPRGDKVKINSGPFQGSIGEVDYDDGITARILVGFARILVQITSCSLSNSTP